MKRQIHIVFMREDTDYSDDTSSLIYRVYRSKKDAEAKMEQLLKRDSYPLVWIESHGVVKAKKKHYNDMTPQEQRAEELDYIKGWLVTHPEEEEDCTIEWAKEILKYAN